MSMNALLIYLHLGRAQSARMSKIKNDGLDQYGEV